MFIKLCLVLISIQIAQCQSSNHEWDIAVAIGDKIQLLHSNGTLLETTFPQFSKLKALTFDNVRQQFVVSDMDQMNDTIFTVQLNKETDITPIVEDLPDDVQGLAIDPITDTLYWTDSVTSTISSLPLNDTNRESQELFRFLKGSPQDVTVDICHRYLYWTNSDTTHPTIERSYLDGSNHEILIDSDLHRPRGITIDHYNNRIYWADIRHGIYYRIESATLEGKERQVLVESTHSKPFGIAADFNYVYWTDTTNNAVWMAKTGTNKESPNDPKILIKFKEAPMGIVTRSAYISTLDECQDNGDFKEPSSLLPKPTAMVSGIASCSLSVCHNFCLNGECSVDIEGRPRCYCNPGYGGVRCEHSLCDGHCLNGGNCSIENGVAMCKCYSGFNGPRCEANGNTVELCKVFCGENVGEELTLEGEDFVCRCADGAFTITHLNASPLTMESRLQDPFFLLMAVFVMILLPTTCVAIALNLRKRRPRIKKRIIVNKNITPLTCRPQPTTEHCEITIEDCCNMNVCETPCFEPPQLRGLHIKNEDKKTLLSHMENGEDLY